MFLHLLLWVLCLGLVVSVPLRLFYPYGDSRNDEVLRTNDDHSSTEIQLRTPINFFDNLFTSIFVNSNGHLSFETELPGYLPTLVLPLEMDVKLIAAFLSDVDTTVAGKVYYRETTEEALKQRAASDVRTHFSQYPRFEPLGLFIATWDNVAAYGGDESVGNTFQIVIASDELSSFAIFNYLDKGIRWTTGAGKLAGLREDPPAQAGFDSGSGRLHHKLPYSGTQNVDLLAEESNVDLPGTWMYRIGTIREGKNVEEPDMNTGDVEILQPEVLTPTCLEGSRKCHMNARCIDFPEGYCCECVPPYYGNGLQCVENGTSQRLNGKVSGVINGVSFDSLDMHSFVVTKDGRAYTAISRVPVEIGPHMMTLNTIGGIIGWLFALPTSVGAFNGYSFSGGTFNRTAIISYQQGGVVVIRQRFFGHDALNNIRMETYINGTVPEITNGEKVTVDEYKEEYRRVAPGVIRSYSDRTYRIKEVAKRYTWNQTITFDECTLDSARAIRDTMRVAVTRNFVVYDPNDRVVRYAMSNKIGLVTGTDPCREGVQTCDTNAACIPTGDTYTCECKAGYTGDGYFCEDLDECAIGLNYCDANAICYNSPGSFQCRCNPGFTGDGRTCTRDLQLCGDSICDENARCVFNEVESRPMCECRRGFFMYENRCIPDCKTGFRRDGGRCVPITFDCNEADICHENAECLFDPTDRRYKCECVEGYSGDGVYCEAHAVDPACLRCDDNAQCVFDSRRIVYTCVCREGYTGDGVYCVEISDQSVCSDCHPNAECVYDQSALQYRCQCSAGYQGDGTRCEPYDCRQADLCDPNARCGQDSQGYYVCRCNPGFRGDGRRCEPEGCNIVNNCDVNAECIPDPRDTSRYLCRCNRGFEGDGTVCIRRVIPCNQVDNCSQFGECVYDPENRDYRCRCSRGYEGDGFTCRPRGIDCRRDSRLCDPNAECLLNVDTFVCVCNQGYRGDGTSCTRIRDEMNYLLFTRGYTIHKVPHRGNGMDTNGARVLYVPDELAVAVSADCQDHLFYWTDVTGGKISRASLEGYDKEVVARGFKSPEGLAIDWLSRNMYVTDSELDIIAVTTLNGTYKKTLIRDNLVNPRAIVVDPQRGMMYWTDWYRDNPTIEKAYMDGTDRKVFIESDLGLPNGLTIDYATQQICWGDAGVNRIECIRADGVGRRVVTEDAPYPFDVALYGNTMYWSDWTIDGIPMIHRNGGEKGEPLTLPVGGNGRLYGITSVGEYCPRATSACLRNNGGCRYLCLPTPNGGRTCACPDDIDEITCSEIGTLRKKKK